MTEQDPFRAITVAWLEANWDQQGECRSCGWHALLGEYDLPEDLEIDAKRRRIQLSCLNKDDEERWSHRGVWIPMPPERYEP